MIAGPKLILRFYNDHFNDLSHDYRCNQIFGFYPKLTKFYGEYQHATIGHLATVSRVIAPSSLHMESQERLFGTLRMIGLATSQRGPASVREVGIVRWIKGILIQINDKLFKYSYIIVDESFAMHLSIIQFGKEIDTKISLPN